MYRVFAILIKSPTVFFIEIEMLILQFIQKHMRPRESKQSYRRTKLEGSFFLILSLIWSNSDEDSVRQEPGQTQALLIGKGRYSKGRQVTQHKGSGAWWGPRTHEVLAGPQPAWTVSMQRHFKSQGDSDKILNTTHWKSWGSLLSITYLSVINLPIIYLSS